jgi:hypothetical protein
MDRVEEIISTFIIPGFDLYQIIRTSRKHLEGDIVKSKP